MTFARITLLTSAPPKARGMEMPRIPDRETASSSEYGICLSRSRSAASILNSWARAVATAKAWASFSISPVESAKGRCKGVFMSSNPKVALTQAPLRW
ncbi:hypothetical protein APX70_200565 [Pseudomonas syringae pv. maculicola]|uniref:Uncharacterized protein n=1 Tax=Pseudomonas syringae pv. maculicola TaxID=59511 RepID=A0A3M2XC73_PSEYM|nr:hypothetical protein APX70_200565 [Pseudomonas syringae pv. maculicola]